MHGIVSGVILSGQFTLILNNTFKQNIFGSDQKSATAMASPAAAAPTPMYNIVFTNNFQTSLHKIIMEQKIL